MESTAENEFNMLSFYTLAHPDKVYFIHQHIVDAYRAQTADEQAKSISIIFSLIGLYLAVEKNYSGRQVQLAHMKLAQNKQVWPPITLPAQRGEITVTQVLQAKPGVERDEMIKDWCVSVWKSFSKSHEIISSLARSAIGLG